MVKHLPELCRAAGNTVIMHMVVTLRSSEMGFQSGLHGRIWGGR